MLSDHRDLGLFLVSLFCSFGLCACFYATTRLFDYSGLVILFVIRYCDPSCLVLVSQNCCSYSKSFMVPYEFLKCLFYICEICQGYFSKDRIESINCFGYLSLTAWIISLSIMLSSSSHAIAKGISSLFLSAA